MDPRNSNNLFGVRRKLRLRSREVFSSASGNTRKWTRLALTICLTTLLMICFQNFQPIPLERLMPERAYARVASPTDGSADIRTFAPVRTHTIENPTLATPQSGHDMNSVGRDWLNRQTRLLTGGAEERVLADFNRRLNRMLNLDSSENDDEQMEPLNNNSNSAMSANEPMAKKNKKSREPASVDSDLLGFRPTSLNVVSSNRLQVGLKNNTRLSCSFEGSNMRWDIERPLNARLDLNFRHESSAAKSTLNLNYSW